MELEKIYVYLKTYKIHICIFLFLCFSIFVGYFLFSKQKEEVEEPVFVNENKEDEKTNYFVDIKGAVTTPGVYEMEKDSRIQDVINKAGGFKENANLEYINLGKKIKDEMVIIIYTNEEIQEFVEGNKTIKYIDKTCICPKVQNDGCIEKGKTITNKKEETKNESSIINLNTATKEELETLPFIGTAKAEDIIEYREKTPLKKIEDIQNIKGIGKSIFEKIKNRITV